MTSTQRFNQIEKIQLTVYRMKFDIPERTENSVKVSIKNQPSPSLSFRLSAIWTKKKKNVYKVQKIS